MSETKHTPGPWMIVNYGDGDSLVTHSDSESRICFMATPGSHGDPAKIEADARLIAAAPDMAKALEIIAKAELYDPATGIMDADVLDACQAAARAALAKARGLA